MKELKLDPLGMCVTGEVSAHSAVVTNTWLIVYLRRFLLTLGLFPFLLLLLVSFSLSL